MDNFNKVISFVLGLVVVVVFLAVVSGRLNLKNKLASSGGATVSPTQAISEKIDSLTIQPNKYQTSTVAKKPSTIPSTGAPLFLFPVVISSFLGGIYLRRSGKK